MYIFNSPANECWVSFSFNFNQYDQYGFPAAYPSLLHGEPPRDKVGYPIYQDLFQCLLSYS